MHLKLKNNKEHCDSLEFYIFKDFSGYRVYHSTLPLSEYQIHCRK